MAEPKPIKVPNVSMDEMFKFFTTYPKYPKPFKYELYSYAIRESWSAGTGARSRRTSPKTIEVYAVIYNARHDEIRRPEIMTIYVSQIAADQVRLDFETLPVIDSEPQADTILRTFWTGLTKDLHDYTGMLEMSDYPVTEKLLPFARPKFRHAWWYKFDDNKIDKKGRKFWEKLHEMCGKDASIRYMAKELKVSEDYINRCLGKSQNYIIPGWGGKKKVREKLASLDRKLIS